MKVVVAGQVHWKWWNKQGKRLLSYSPWGASIPEKRQRQQDHERQKKVWSRGQKENNSCLSSLPVEARLIECLCSLLSIWIYWPIMIHSQKPLTISSWLKTVIPNLLPRFRESTLWTHLMRKQQIHAERDLTHSPATQKAYIFLDHTSQSTHRIQICRKSGFISSSTSGARCFSEDGLSLWVWEALENFISLGQIRLIFILLFLPVFRAARLCLG